MVGCATIPGRDIWFPFWKKSRKLFSHLRKSLLPCLRSPGGQWRLNYLRTGEKAAARSKQTGGIDREERLKTLEWIWMLLFDVICRGICLKWPSYTQINEILQYLGCSYWWPIRQRPITKRCTFFGAFHQNFGTFAVMVRSTQFSSSPVGWMYWPIWIPRLSGYLYFGTQNIPPKRSRN